jgi:hypothetical protein
MEALGISDLPGSGLRFPPEDWDWHDCCHACVWMAISGRELSSGLEARMLLGPSNPLVKLYVEWSSKYCFIDSSGQARTNSGIVCV